VTKAKPATVRFYFDADILGLAKIIAQLRGDVTFPGDVGGTVHKRTRPACPIEKTATRDHEWIPVVAAHGWLIITRDRHIQERRAELAAVRDHGARLVALAGADATGTWAQLEVLMAQWRRLEALLDEPAPLVRSATRTSLRPVSLD
jgi:PIN like domain